ncbi:MAG: DUF302 domain-containing protein [Pseudomonadota bacterium]
MNRSPVSAGMLRLAGLAVAALFALAACVTVGVDANVKDLRRSAAPYGYLTTKSDADFATTLARLQMAIDKRGLRTFVVVDHAAGAASVGETLRPTTLVVFGSPKVGTPLMQAAQTAGADLPLKALVYETANGAAYVALSDPDALFANHDVEGLAELKDRMRTTLKAIAGDAAGA